jgi:hypothetical protein
MSTDRSPARAPRALAAPSLPLALVLAGWAALVYVVYLASYLG